MTDVTPKTSWFVQSPATNAHNYVEERLIKCEKPMTDVTPPKQVDLLSHLPPMPTTMLKRGLLNVRSL